MRSDVEIGKQNFTLKSLEVGNGFKFGGVKCFFHKNNTSAKTKVSSGLSVFGYFSF